MKRVTEGEKQGRGMEGRWDSYRLQLLNFLIPPKFCLETTTLVLGMVVLLEDFFCTYCWGWDGVFFCLLSWLLFALHSVKRGNS